MEESTYNQDFMEAALDLARAAGNRGEVPIGAVVVCNNRIVGRGQNVRETEQNVLGHAELAALQEACSALGSWRLDDCDLYVTLEPCLMCAGAILHARIRNLYYGAYDPKAGAVSSCWRVFDQSGLNHRVRAAGGYLEEQASALITSFFKDLRRQNKITEAEQGGRGARKRSAKTVGRKTICRCQTSNTYMRP